MQKKQISIQVGLALAGTLAFPIMAQEQLQGLVLEEVMVTAQKRSESSQDVPISVQAFGAQTLEQLGATEVMDLSRSAPSLSVGGVPGNIQQMGIRGVVDYSRNVGINARMGVYIDGVYQGRSASANQPLLGLESVEVLRGPQGTLFGKNTVSGAINLNTRKASDEFTGEVTAGGGNEGYWTGSGYVNGPFTDQLFGSISASKQHRDGYYRNTVTDKDFGDWDQQGTRGQLRWLPSDPLEIILAGDYAKTDSDLPISTRATDKPFEATKGIRENNTVEFWGTSATVNYMMANDYEFTSISAYRHTKSELLSDESFSAAASMISFVDEKSSQISQELRLVSPLEGDYDWVAGLYFFDTSPDDVSTDRNITFAPSFLGAASGNIAIPSTASTTSYSAYIHGNYRFANSLELTAGIRGTLEDQEFDFTQINTPDNPDIVGPGYPGLAFEAGDLSYKAKNSDTAVSPTVGINYTPTDDVLLYAKYARGNQSGGWNGDYRTTGLDRIQFDPESVDAYEAGLKSTMFDGQLRFNTDVFVQEYDDFQVFQLLNVNGQPIQELTNAGQATSQGVEMETIWLPTDALQLTFNGTYLDATYDKFPNPGIEFDPNAKAYDGNDLAYAPEWKLFAAAEFVQPLSSLGDLTFHVDYSYQAHSFGNAANRKEIEGIPSFELWNARITFRPTSEQWQAQLYVDNIADEEYIVNHYENTIFRFDRVYWGAPRFYGANFTYYF